MLTECLKPSGVIRRRLGPPPSRFPWLPHHFPAFVLSFLSIFLPPHHAYPGVPRLAPPFSSPGPPNRAYVFNAATSCQPSPLHLPALCCAHLLPPCPPTPPTPPPHRPLVTSQIRPTVFFGSVQRLFVAPTLLSGAPPPQSPPLAASLAHPPHAPTPPSSPAFVAPPSPLARLLAHPPHASPQIRPIVVFVGAREKRSLSLRLLGFLHCSHWCPPPPGPPPVTSQIRPIVRFLNRGQWKERCTLRCSHTALWCPPHLPPLPASPPRPLRHQPNQTNC